MIHRRSTVPTNKISKKRKKSIIPWRKDVDKYRRCQPKGPPLPPSCNHSCSKFECTLLGKSEMETFHRKFYYTRNKAQQDAFLLRYCQGMSPKRKSSVAQKDRKLTVEYYVPVRERKVQVCKEAFIGILRVNKSRVNALLKSFYKIDFSKDSTRDGQPSSRLKRRCRGRKRKKRESRNDLPEKSQSLANIEHSTQSEFSIEYRCQSESEGHGRFNGYSITLIENKDEEEKLINNGSETKLYDWLNVNSKARRHRTFNWSPLRQASRLASNAAEDGKIMECSMKKNVPEVSNPFQCYSSNTVYQNHISKEAADQSIHQSLSNPRISLHDLSHVYESKKRRLRKLQIIDGKENVNQNRFKKENNINYSNYSDPEQTMKSTVADKKIAKTFFLKSKAKIYVLKTRFPLRTLC